MSEPERIAKRLARAGLCSRRDAERWIADGRVKVDGTVLTTPAFVVTDASAIEVDGKPLPQADRARLWRYHKPPEEMVTARDPQGRRTIFDSLPKGMPRVVTVGRLDYFSEGLLLLTNDGGLARKLELPANGWTRRYRARVHGAVDVAKLAALANGITIEGVHYGRDPGQPRPPAALQRLARHRADRGQEPRGAQGAGPSRPAGDAPDPRRLRPVPPGRARARHGRRGADPGDGEPARRAAGAAQGGLGQAQAAPEPAQAADALMLKVVGGRHRGRSIATPEGDTTRPTSSRARESLFNILAHASWRDDGTSPLIDARVLDAFAGSGALGIEALSRGAAHATFLDNDATAIKLIGENLRKLGETDNAKVVRADATRPPPSREACDLVFLDPPYRSGQAAPALAALAEAGWLKPGAIATVELANTEDMLPPPGFATIDERRYGLAKIVILRRTP